MVPVLLTVEAGLLLLLPPQSPLAPKASATSSNGRQAAASHLSSRCSQPLFSLLLFTLSVLSPGLALTRGANVYISCSRLLCGAPEFILQPVVMACFLDKSWQPLVVDS